MIAALAVAFGLLAPAAGPAVPAVPAHAARTTAVGIGLTEYRITVYRPTVKEGTVEFFMTNVGQDAHNLEVRGPHHYRSAVSADVAPGGGHGTLRVHLTRAGTYTLLCEKPGHAMLGMRATLRVTRH